VKAGQGDPKLPAKENESVLDYIERLAKFLGYKIDGAPLKTLTVKNREPGQEG
jgi:hypothetical protein